uniref:Uncharacterized protein n=1 Tax=Arundo donax TaxID=35708 RepID=A0A0A9BMJ2_ARUDO
MAPPFEVQQAWPQPTRFISGSDFV